MHLRVCALASRLVSIVFRSDPIRCRFSHSEACLRRAASHHLLYDFSTRKCRFTSPIAHSIFHLSNLPFHSSPLSKSRCFEGEWLARLNTIITQCSATHARQIGAEKHLCHLLIDEGALDDGAAGGGTHDKLDILAAVEMGQDLTLIICVFRTRPHTRFLATLTRLHGRPWLFRVCGGAFQAALFRSFFAGGFPKGWWSPDCWTFETFPIPLRLLPMSNNTTCRTGFIGIFEKSCHLFRVHLFRLFFIGSCFPSPVYVRPPSIICLAACIVHPCTIRASIMF